MAQVRSIVLIILLASLHITVYGCGNPPPKVNGRNKPDGSLSVWPIDQHKRCVGEGNYQMSGLTNMTQMTDCSLACLEYGCAAINIHKTSDTTFECFIVTRFSSVIPQTDWACYYAH
ncbi:hypothetical protein Tcan_09638 [Toxocara canis]|uniref:Apple domain-containing protein n=1 Tax=Toxocara canis TaxID=6265 RepID=A0A0B2UYE7_TOXCA|nr:hypothetical protein Tcan_09638 [Toxocara canis]